MEKDKLKRWGTVIGGGFAAVLLIYFIGMQFIQPQINFSRVSFVAEDTDVQETNRDIPEDYYTYSKLHLNPEDSVLIDSLTADYINVGIENLDDVPLLTQVAANYEEALANQTTTVEPLPWFYYSPNIAEISPTSYANYNRLLEKESVNGFAWIEQTGAELLFRNAVPYTGWYSIPEEGWFYYAEGIQQAINVSYEEAQEWADRRNLLLTLVPMFDYNFFFVERPYKYNEMNVVTPVNYSILYKNTDSMILTAPPKTDGSRLLSTTVDFFDMPMEVVEEYETYNETWLHVYIGYEELGWVRKDDQLEDYVNTYYSERELLDTIESVLWEEIDLIAADVGASFINNETMAQVNANSHPFFPASTQKIYVLGELYHQYKTGELAPETTMTLTDWDKVPGAGIIQGHSSGSIYTLDELVNLVAIYSDNTAANMLINVVGGGEVINPHMHQLGLHETYVNGLYYSGASDNFRTTPNDAARFFALLYNNQVNGEPYDELLISKFNLNTHNFLRQYIPYDTHSWNKSGLGGTEQNDVATFVTPYGSYSLAVYTAYPADYDGMAHQLGTLSLRVHEVFNELRSQLWITVE